MSYGKQGIFSFDTEQYQSFAYQGNCVVITGHVKLGQKALQLGISCESEIEIMSLPFK